MKLIELRRHHLARPRVASPASIKAARVGAAATTTDDGQNNLFANTSGNWSLASTIGMGLSTYHGYKRNNSVGWALGWGLLGGLFPIPTVAIALAQGFGKKP